MKKNILKKKLLLSVLSLLMCTQIFSQTEVIFYTNFGNFEADIYDSIKPITAGNFLDLVDSSFYDDIIFHRVIEDFIIQSGDPLGTGYGGPGYTISDEFDSTLSNIQKTFSMANSGPNSGGSQFFINMVDNIGLDSDNSPLSSAHPIFGIVTTGWNIVDSIQSTPVDFADKPITTVKFDSIRRKVDEVPYDSTTNIIGLEKRILTASVYPNPISYQSKIIINGEFNSEYSIIISTINGKILKKINVKLNKNSEILLTDLYSKELKKGFYYIILENENEKVIKSILKL